MDILLTIAAFVLVLAALTLGLLWAWEGARNFKSERALVRRAVLQVLDDGSGREIRVYQLFLLVTRLNKKEPSLGLIYIIVDELDKEGVTTSTYKTTPAGRVERYVRMAHF